MDELRAKLRRKAGSTGALFLLTAAAVALAACGGDSDGGGPAPHAGGHVRAAGATPVAGIVTQSSHRSDGVTASPVDVTLEASGGALAATVDSPGWDFGDQTVEETVNRSFRGTTWKGLRLGRVYGDGGKRFVSLFTDADPADFDDDYLVFGYWLRVPARFLSEDGSPVALSERSTEEFVSDSEYGVFAAGGDPFEQANIQALTGTATYTGDATAFYVDAANDKESELSATVTLTADFGTNAQLGTIQGSVGSFVRHHGGSPEAGELTDTEIGLLGTLNLHAANIGDSDSGFFTANTSMVVDNVALAGKWGGQFYGNDTDPTEQPAAVAGTFGATDGGKAIVGAYGASR